MPWPPPPTRINTIVTTSARTMSTARHTATTRIRRLAIADLPRIAPGVVGRLEPIGRVERHRRNDGRAREASRGMHDHPEVADAAGHDPVVARLGAAERSAA